MFTYVLFRLCFLSVGDVFLARSGSVLMNHCLLLVSVSVSCMRS